MKEFDPRIDLLNLANAKLVSVLDLALRKLVVFDFRRRSGKKAHVQAIDLRELFPNMYEEDLVYMIGQNYENPIFYKDVVFRIAFLFDESKGPFGPSPTVRMLLIRGPTAPAWYFEEEEFGKLLRRRAEASGAGEDFGVAINEMTRGYQRYLGSIAQGGLGFKTLWEREKKQLG